MTDPAFPIDPLLSALTMSGWTGRGAQAEATSIHPRHLDRIIDAGEISLDLADRAACSIGSHPIAIWPDEWSDYLERSQDQGVLFDID